MARSELAGMDPGELTDRLAEARRELFNLRFQRATGQLDNTARLGQVRKEVARVLTFLRQQELGIDVDTGPVGAEMVGAQPGAEPADTAEEEAGRRTRRLRRGRAAGAGSAAPDQPSEDEEQPGPQGSAEDDDDTDDADGVAEDSEEA